MTEMMAQFLQSRGGPPSGAPQAPSSQNQSYLNITPEAAAAQMQKLMEMRRTRPPSFGPSQTGTNPHETGGTSNATNAQHIQQVPAWYGTFSAAIPNFGGQSTNEIQIHVAGMFDQPIRADNWPKNLALKICKEPLKDNQELKSWLKHQSRTPKIQFKANLRVPDGSMNEQKFQALYKFMVESRIYAYTGLQIPSGKSIYIVIFPLQSCFIGVIFLDNLPDLPGSGNALDGAPPEVAEPLPLSGLNLPPEILARVQTLEPAKQRQFVAQLLARARRQQQIQQVQAANSHGMPIPYQAIATMPPGLPTNINVPTNAGAFNTGGGTVNYEMLQSFMQRNGESSASQGMNPG